MAIFTISLMQEHLASTLDNKQREKSFQGYEYQERGLHNEYPLPQIGTLQ